MNKVRSAVRTYGSLRVGESVSFERTITARDVRAFAELSGDHNELHTDAAYAKRAKFGGQVVHGMFLGALVSRLVGMHLPGKYCLLVKETLEFKKPVVVGETVRVGGTITHTSDVGRLLELAIEITRGKEIVALGSVHARVLEEPV